MARVLFAAIIAALAVITVIAQRQRQPGPGRSQPGPGRGQQGPSLEEVVAKLPTPGSGEVFVRTIPADVLRDYPGVCFSYSNGDFYSVNSSWAIKGVCGTAVCLELPINDQGRYAMFEQVYDCGPRVKKNFTECAYTREEDLTQEFPKCCPKFTCGRNFNARDLLLPPKPQ